MDRSLEVFKEVAPEKLQSELLATQVDGRYTRNYCERIWSSIGKFSVALLDDDVKPMVTAIGRDGLKRYDLSTVADRYLPLFPEMVKFVGALSDRNVYDEYTELFMSCCRDLGLVRHRLLDPKERWYSKYFRELIRDEQIERAELFDAVVEYIRREGRLRNVRQRSKERERDAKETYKSCVAYFDALCALYPKLLVVRVDLFYRKMVGIPPNMEDLERDFGRMLANRRSNQKVFGGEIGYIAKLEYGLLKGPHLHLVMFFNGAKRNPLHHSHLGYAVGEYWKTVVTKNQGGYFNCNADTTSYISKGVCGIGLVGRNAEFAQNFKDYILRYICKLNAFAKPRYFPKMRLIRKGVVTLEMRARKIRRNRAAWISREKERVRYRRLQMKSRGAIPCLEPISAESCAMLERNLLGLGC